MGVVGLLPYVKKACYEGNINEFKGKTLLVDVSCLLHRGVFGCAGKLAMGQDSELYIGYVQKYVKHLLVLECHVILVFDGRSLPAKKETNDSRRECREKYQSLGCELLSQGLTAEAHRAFSKGVTLTREVVEKTIKTFNKIKNVDTIIAPYEADAQIAYMMKEGYADAVVTEDSDLIVFGCDKIIFKMDPGTGFCVIYEKHKLPNCVCPVLRRRFDFVTFRRICILAGCDYLQGGLQGVGLKTAEEVFTKASSHATLPSVLIRLQLYTNKRLKVKVDADFVDAFVRAENTFLYQIVFDPLKREQRPLNAYPETGEEKENLLDSEKKYHYAGESSLEDEFVLPSEIPVSSIWNSNYKKVLEKEKDQLEKELDNKFGAFRPKKSLVKRPADNESISPSPCHEERKRTNKGEIDTIFTKRRRFSEIQIGSAAPRNGAYTNWTARDWMRIYGQLTQKEGEEEENNSSRSSEMSSQ
ncbi:hypothetical protein niasHS_006624 [Heterodera schachtii]|uniref:Exonuclease 1 n=1 Tax=Heterodera schachtii TaxID=97005 RepID=A0ABD2JI29_HETSC